MVKSIRWRLQVWYAVVLTTVVAGFAGLLFYQVRAARFQEIDVQLEAGALYLEAALRVFPPFELEGPRPGEPGPPPGGPPRGPDDRPGGPGPRPGGPPGPPPPRPNPERLWADLSLPRELGAGAGERPYFVVWRQDGRLLKSVGLPEDAPPGPAAPAGRPHVLARGDFREVEMVGPRNTRIRVGRSVRRELAELRSFAWQLGGAGLLVLLVGLAGGWLLSARVVRPIAAMSRTASAISAADLSHRIDTAQVDTELAELAGVLNAMFDRLEAAFQRQAQFTADASHELRTPLAIIRTQAELALARSRSPEEYRQALETCLRAAGRMSKLVDGLLTLARADAGSTVLKAEPVELSAVVAESVSLVRPLAQERRIKMTAELASADVAGDATALAQVVTNLLHNAIQYNRADGTIHVALTSTPEEARLTVSDTGCGIPEEDQPFLFERFYRVDKARSRAVGGNGLGLAICKSIVEAHGGRIGFESKRNEGATFWVRLPRRATAEGNNPPVVWG